MTTKTLRQNTEALWGEVVKVFTFLGEISSAGLIFFERIQNLDKLLKMNYLWLTL